MVKANLNQSITIEKAPRGVRLIALFEAGKGLAVLIGGIALLEFFHGNLADQGARLMTRMGVDTHTYYAAQVLEKLSGISDQDVALISSVALTYAIIRFAEAYGLWLFRNWARWLGIVSGALYVPFELYHLYLGFSWLKLLITATNILLVIYLYKVQLRKTITITHSASNGPQPESPHLSEDPDRADPDNTFLS